MLKYFRDLGQRIDSEWLRADFSHAAFPEICARALDATPAHRSVRARDIVRWGLSSLTLPVQHDEDAAFGEPPLSTYVGRGFFIAVNFWLSSTTAIHNHSFSGAFQVLEGSSLETQFRFTPERIFNAYMALGSVDEISRTVLRPGETREIRAGSTIHSLFHLEHPSATVVVRTGRDPDAAPQLSYHRPNVAIDPRYNPNDLFRRKQLFTLLAKTEPRRLAYECLQHLGRADFASRFLGLRHCVSLLSPEDGDDLLKRASSVDSMTARLVADVVEGERRERFLVSRRGSVVDPDLRFFLAILLNVRGRDDALALVADRHPERDPVLVILDWIRHLALAPGPAGAGSNALGFPADDVTLGVLDGALRGHHDAQIARSVGSAARRTLSKRDRRELSELRGALEESEIFRYLLQKTCR